jgi:hypothetical protein
MRSSGLAKVGVEGLMPGGAEPLLQGADILIQDFWLGHAAAISKCNRQPDLLIRGEIPSAEGAWSDP